MPAPTEHHWQQDRRAMEQTRPPMLRGLSLVEVAYRGDRVQAPVLHTEPQVMVGVNDDAGGPRPQHLAAEPREQQGCGRGRQRNMISNAHDDLPITRVLV